MGAESTPDRQDLIAASFAQSDRPLMLLSGGGNVVAASLGTGRLFGCAAEDLVGQGIVDLVRPPEVMGDCVTMGEVT